MIFTYLRRDWFLVTPLDLVPGPTRWHGLSLWDFHPLETAHCFTAAIAIFLGHWGIYRHVIHGVPSWLLRSALASATVVSYLLAVLFLQPWQPYWIRELSLMLAQLFSWKVADLAALRHGEPLLPGFWSFIIFDVLVLRPTALVLPAGTGATPPAAAPPPVAASAAAAAAPELALAAAAVAKGRLGLSGEASAKVVAAATAGLVRQPPGSGWVHAELERAGARSGAAAAAAAVKLRNQSTAAADSAASGGAIAAAVHAAAFVAVGATAAAATSKRASNAFEAQPPAAAAGKWAESAKSRAPTHEPNAAPYCSLCGSTGSSSSSSCSCGRGSGSSGGGVSCCPATAAGLAVRFVLAAGAVRGPLVDFLWTYNACEAINAYLMHRRAEDVLTAPLLAQAWLSTCFATTLYFHLRYFFHSMEMLWLGGFALAAGVRVERWQPLFNSPECSTSPVDFWNNRWHQAFRWWWTRLVFNPVRWALRRLLDGPGGLRGEDEGITPAAAAAGTGSSAVVWEGAAEAGRHRQRRVEGRRRDPSRSPPAARRWFLPAWFGWQRGDKDSQKLRPHEHRHQHGHGHGHPKRRKNKSRRGGCNPKHENCRDDDGGEVNAESPDNSRLPRKRKHGSSGGGMAAGWFRRNRSAVLQAVPTFAVFMFSAVFHETLLWINFGRPTGEQTAFFLFHATLVLAQRAAERAAPSLTLTLAARVPAPLRAAGFMSLMGLSSVMFFRPWFRSSYHRELRVLVYGPSGWAVRVWLLGLPRHLVRLVW